MYGEDINWLEKNKVKNIFIFIFVNRMNHFAYEE